MLVLVGLKVCAVAVHGRGLTTTLNVLLGFRWFEAMEQKPSYLGTKSDFYTHVHDLPPQLGGESLLLDCSQPHRTTNIYAAAVTGLLSLVLGAVSEHTCLCKGSKLLPPFVVWQCTCERSRLVRCCISVVTYTWLLAPCTSLLLVSWSVSIHVKL